MSDLFPPNLVPVIGNSQADFNDRLFKTDMTNFAPRIGLGWRPFGAQSFVIRTGYGIFYESLPRAPSLFSVPFIVSESGFTNPKDIQDPQFVQWPLAFPLVTKGAGVSIPGTWENGFRAPYAQNWSFTIEKEVLAVAVRTSYVGTGGRQAVH